MFPMFLRVSLEDLTPPFILESVYSSELAAYTDGENSFLVKPTGITTKAGGFMVNTYMIETGDKVGYHLLDAASNLNRMWDEYPSLHMLLGRTRSVWASQKFSIESWETLKRTGVPSEASSLGLADYRNPICPECGQPAEEHVKYGSWFAICPGSVIVRYHDTEEAHCLPPQVVEFIKKLY